MTLNTSKRPARILVVEDNPADVKILQEALKKGDITHSLDVVGDGEAALDFLYRRERYATAQRPDLILLDLNLPKIKGHEVLSKIKQDEKLKTIPVVILSSSENEKDIRLAYELHANTYIVKRSDLTEFLMMGQCLKNYWFNMSTLPKQNEAS